MNLKQISGPVHEENYLFAFSCFSHVQLYFAFSRAENPEDVKI